MYDCIVIGAGPGGLCATKHLLEQDLNVLCLEKTDRIGGVYANTYDNLELTSSAVMSMYSDFWIGEGYEHAFWTKNDALDYWQRYADYFGVLKKIQYNSTVVDVKQVDDGWKITVKTKDNGNSIMRAKRIALAIGNNSLPNYPDWAKHLTDVNHTHSMTFKNAKHLAGKNVLVIGGGESGSDMALEASHVAKNCWISLRNSTGWVIPKHYGSIPSDISTHRGVLGLPREFGPTLSEDANHAYQILKCMDHDTALKLNKMVKVRKGVFGTYATKTFSLPVAIAQHGCKLVGGVVKVEDGGRTIHTSDGKTLKNVDAVIFATGYKNMIKFLPQKLQYIDPRSLYKHMYHAHYGDSIAWIGWARPNFGSQFSIMEMQSRLLALVCKGKHSLPGPLVMEEVAATDHSTLLDQFEYQAHHIRSLVDYLKYMDQMAAIIGCAPPLKKYFLTNTKLWLTMVYGPINSTQFRLVGPDAKKEEALEILRKLPVSKFNFAVQSGLKGRLFFAFFSLLPNRISSLNPSPLLVNGFFRTTLSLTTILIVFLSICRFVDFSKQRHYMLVFP